MAGTHITTVAEATRFGIWLLRNTDARVGAAVNAVGDTLVLSTDAGTRWTVRLTDQLVARAVITTLREHVRRVWAYDATAVALTVAGELGLPVERLDFISSIDVAHATMTPGVEQPSPPKAPARRATDAARDAGRLSTTHPRTVRRTGMASVRQDALWRPTQQRGLRLDMRMLERESNAAFSVQAALADELGVDLTRDDDATYAWLVRRGISILDPSGTPTLSRDHFDRAVIPEHAHADWRVFRDARRVKTRLAKLREFGRAERGGLIFPTVLVRGGTKTGRMVTRAPGYHNLNRDLRGLIRTHSGVFVGIDIDRAEPSVAAAMSGDRKLADALAAGDPYVELAVAQYGESARADKELRDRFKRVFLASGFYGQGAASLSADLGIPIAEAKAVRQRLRNAWPVLDRWLSGIRRTAGQGTGLFTISGRPLPVAGPGEAYKAVNWMVQGSAADLAYRAVEQTVANLETEFGPGVALLTLGVHDEFVFEVPEQLAEQCRVLVEDSMALTVNGVRIGGTAAVLGSRWSK